MEAWYQKLLMDLKNRARASLTTVASDAIAA